SLPAALLKAGTDGLDGPVDDRVGSVVEHLADDLAANAGVAAAFDLDQGRNGILVEKQVVQRPPVPSFVLGRDTHLPRDQEPPSWCSPIRLIAGQQVWVFGEKLLEHVLGVIGLLRHLHEIATTLNQENAAIHRTPASLKQPSV